MEVRVQYLSLLREVKSDRSQETRITEGSAWLLIYFTRPKPAMPETPDIEMMENNKSSKKYTPRLNLQRDLQKYVTLGASSTAILRRNLQIGAMRPGEEIHSTEQLNGVQEIDTEFGVGLDLEYRTRLSREIHIRRARIDALRKALALPQKVYNSHNYRGRSDISEMLDKLRDDLEGSVAWFAEKKADNLRAETSPSVKFHSNHVLLLRARLEALQESVKGVSYSAKGGIPNLHSAPLGFAMAARHLERYVSFLTYTKKFIAYQLNQLRDDIDFETRLNSELKSIAEITVARSANLETDSQTRLTDAWITNTIERKKKETDKESKQLMSSLRYLIQNHLAPYLSLHAYKLPDLSRGGLAKKQKTFTGERVSGNRLNSENFEVELHIEAPNPDIDLSDASQISGRLQSLLLSLLNQLIKSSPQKEYYTQVTSVNDPLVRFLLAADIVTQPQSGPHLIHLRNFGTPT